jgi:hypothetical protein
LGKFEDEKEGVYYDGYLSDIVSCEISSNRLSSTARISMMSRQYVDNSAYIASVFSLPAPVPEKRGCQVRRRGRCSSNCPQKIPGKNLITPGDQFLRDGAKL